MGFERVACFTAKEMIEELQRLPPETPVVYEDSELGILEVLEVRAEREIRLGRGWIFKKALVLR